MRAVRLGFFSGVLGVLDPAPVIWWFFSVKNLCWKKKLKEVGVDLINCLALLLVSVVPVRYLVYF
jgi:hypothetical protein